MPANAYPAPLSVELCATFNPRLTHTLAPASLPCMLSHGIQDSTCCPQNDGRAHMADGCWRPLPAGCPFLWRMLRRMASRAVCAVPKTATCCRSTSGLSLPDTAACRPPVPLPRILSHGLQEREFHVHSEPVRQGLNKALGELERMIATFWGTALQGVLQRFQGQIRVLGAHLPLAAGTVDSALHLCGYMARQQNP